MLVVGRGARAPVFLMLSGGRGMTTKLNGARSYWAVFLSAVNHKGAGMTDGAVPGRALTAQRAHAIKTSSRSVRPIRRFLSCLLARLGHTALRRPRAEQTRT